jgi:hypothetical protein
LNGQPLYVSMTTISERTDKVVEAVFNIMNGAVIPNHIFLFVSSDPYMLDRGIREQDIPVELYGLMAAGIVTVVNTDNIGPHRKLLPMLQQ